VLYEFACRCGCNRFFVISTMYPGVYDSVSLVCVDCGNTDEVVVKECTATKDGEPSGN